MTRNMNSNNKLRVNEEMTLFGFDYIDYDKEHKCCLLQSLTNE